MQSWWQRKVLQYGLVKSGLFEDGAVNLDDLNISWGRRNVVELKDLALNVTRIAKLAKLPPGLRVETAKVLLLRLTVPTDLFTSGIEAEVEGVELTVELVQDDGQEQDAGKARARSPVAARSPQHRKVHRRLRSPPPHGPGGLAESDEDVHIPTAEELAKSFLLDESVQERRKLEASLAADARGLDESIMSESSESGDVGTGAPMSVPGFLAGFIQGMQDRMKVIIRNIDIRVQTEIAAESQDSMPVTLRLRIGSVGLNSVEEAMGSNQHPGKRNVEVRDVSVDLLSDASVFSELSEIPSYSSSTGTKRSLNRSSSEASLRFAPTVTSGAADSHITLPGKHAANSIQAQGFPVDPNALPSALYASNTTTETASHPANDVSLAELDIQPGDDNISWGSRRSKASAPTEDLWSSRASDEDLPNSLLLERAPTPRANSSRSQSPMVPRNRRPVSPYDRGMQSPGSWPQPEENSDRQHVRQSPGSWPMLEQSQQHSFYQPLTPGPAIEYDEDYMDNKRIAFDAADFQHQSAVSDLSSSEVLPESDEALPEDMAQSRFYSHEEAESLYMSAMAPASTYDVPGGWRSDKAASEPSALPNSRRHDSVDDAEAKLPAAPRLPPTPPTEDHDDPSGNATPRAQSPTRTTPTFEDLHLESKQLLSIDHVVLWVPVPGSNASAPAATGPPPNARSTPTSRDMPGTFSAYSELAASRYQNVSASRLSRSTMAVPEPASTNRGPGQQLEVHLGTVTGSVDLSSCRILYKAAAVGLSLSAKSEQPEAKSRNAKSKPVAAPASPPPVFIAVECIRLSLMERLAADGDAQADVGLVSLQIAKGSLTHATGSTELRLGRVQAWISGSELLAFDRQSALTTSVILTESTPDISVIASDKTTVQGRAVKDLTVETLPVKLSLDLSALDDTLGSFGGLSGVLELSNSFMSESGPLGSPRMTAKPAKGVRFAGDGAALPTGPEWKVNGRVGGADVTLRGETCAVNLRTTTLKAVYREHGAVATVEHIVLTGPHRQYGKEAPLSLDLATLRLEYLFAPTDKDLERLISLLTPSKDKYDNDDDILIDTLLRQRRKGALARAAFGDVKLKVANYECFQDLAALGSEFGKLSAVTKYLPEDDRPGLLSLIRVKDFEAQLPVNDTFGKLHLHAQDFHCAHVGLPALIALSLGSVNAMRAGRDELVHALVPLTGSDNLPMLMARMLGDEAEPTVKIKLFNTCIEYSVPVIVALTGNPIEAAEELIADMAQSVTDVIIKPVDGRESASPDKANPASSKRTNIDLLVHDCAIGLSPLNAPSKGLLILTDAKFAALVPPEITLTASLELRKAAVFVTDDRHSDVAGGRPPSRHAPSNTTTTTRLSTALTSLGYASVGSVMSAKVRVSVEDVPDTEVKAIEVDMSNELLLLETCADSTQTLFATLGGLAPPSAPSKQPKYLTEPMTIEDMMASFTGEPVAERQASPDTLFDVSEEPEDDMLLAAPTLGNDEGDDLLAESEMAGSLYGPISGMLGGLDEPDNDDADQDYPETAESLLEDDPFEMTVSPTDAPMGDAALLRDLARQCKTAKDAVSVDLGSSELTDLAFDALDGCDQALGSAHRFNAPLAGRTRLQINHTKEKLPFRLRLHDTHVIWNLYDGYDWQHTCDGITEVVEQVEARAEERKARRRRSHNVEEEEESVIGDFLFNSIYVGVPGTHDAEELRRQINRGIDDLASETESLPVSGMSRPTAYSVSGRPIRQRTRRRLKLERGKAHKIAFELKGVAADVLVFPSDVGSLVSAVDLRLKDLEIFDNVPTSTWRKFLTALEDGPGTREMSKPMAHIEVQNVRTLQDFAASELIIHVSVLPLRLHVDQDALDFVARFFEFKDDRASTPSDPAEQPFIQRLEVDTVDMRLDYKPKRIDYGGLRSGHTTELMNLITLDATNIRLRHAIVYGIKGFEPIHKTLNDIWMPDVQRNQLPTVLAGLAPVRSLVNIGSGVRDVVAIPIREYRKDGRIVRSIQKGALQFGKTTTSELARLGAKLAIGTQNILSGAEGLLAPSSASPSGRPSTERRIFSEQGWHDVAGEDDEHEHRAISAYANQPIGVLSGLRSARMHLERDLLTARDAFIAVQGELLESGSPGAAAAAVARHAPTVILRPVIGASKAVGTTLLGVGNQIDRQNMRRMEDKYKRR